MTHNADVHLGIVVPTYNRVVNLELMLLSLRHQTYKRFYVIIADDGSTDGTRERIDELTATPEWNGRLRWIGCGPNIKSRRSRTRNIGAANTLEGCSLLVFIDSDVVLSPEALSIYAQAHLRHPTVAIMGQTDWLPPLDKAFLVSKVATGEVEDLRSLVPARPPIRIEGTFVGPEIRNEVRSGIFSSSLDSLQPLAPELALGVNVAYPREIFWKLGGYDENMVGYGCEDLELGARANHAGVNRLFLSSLWMLHVWHPKPNSDQAMLENQVNLDYLIRKHGTSETLERVIDWEYWGHYHHDRQGFVLKDGNGTCWAINSRRTHGIRVPDPSWIKRLGWSESDIGSLSQDEQLRHLQLREGIWTL